MSRPVFVEELGAAQLFGVVVQWLWGGRAPLREGGGELFVLYRVSRSARLLAGVLRPAGLRVHEMEYDFFDDVQTPEGIPSVQETFFRAAPALVGEIEQSGPYQEAVQAGAREPAHVPYLRVFLSKRLYLQIYSGVRSVLVAEWFSRVKLGGKVGSAVLCMGEERGVEWLRDYAAFHGVELTLFGGAFETIGHGVRRLKRFVRRVQRALMAGCRRACFPKEPPGNRIAVESYFNGIRHGTIYNTELYWWKEGAFPRGSIFAYFAHPDDQPTPRRKAVLDAMGIGCFDRREIFWRMARPPRGVARRLKTERPRFFADAVSDFYDVYHRWLAFFINTGTRVHVSSSDHFPESEALHAALRTAGGVSVSLQRSIEFTQRLYRRTVVDVHFGFARDSAESERLSGSSVDSFIVAGYPFDAAFPAARAYGEKIAQRLRAKGVTFIVCFFDQSRGFNVRQFGGRRQTQADYSFLCDRLEEDKTLGLVLKPKRPNLLAERLGPVWSRLKKLSDAGRCVYLSGNGVDERCLPAAAAAAADVVINFVDGGTAGLESALLGKKVFLLSQMDDPGLFGELSPRSVVFNNWEDLWECLEEVRAVPDHPILGNWGPILDRLVSLRDGQAAMRIGGYVRWLYEALAAGRNREEAMEEAARRYAAAWGNGWIIHKDSHVEAVPVDTVA